MSTPSKLESVGHLAVRLQLPVARVELAARELGLEPTLTLNGTLYFDGPAAAQISARLGPARRLNAVPPGMQLRTSKSREPRR